MRTMDRHVLVEWLTIFAIVMGATYGLLLLFEVNDSFRDLMKFGAPGGRVFSYYAVVSPSFISYVLPIAVLVSLLYALGQLHRNNEIVAMRSAGVSLWKITRSIWVVVAFLSVLLFNMNSSIVPWSVEEARVIMTNLEFEWLKTQGRDSDEIGVEYNLGYDNRRDRRLWQISKFSRYDHSATGLHVSVFDAEGHEVRRVLAARGVWDGGSAGWTFFDGIEILDPRDPGLDGVRVVPFDRLELPEYREDPAWMALLLRSPKSLSLFELDRVMASTDMVTPKRRAGYAVRYHALLASTFGCLIAAGLAIPYAVSGVRVNPAVGVSKAIGLFGGFLLVDKIFSLLGTSQAVAPWVAGWSPIAIMGGLAVGLMWRAR